MLLCASYVTNCLVYCITIFLCAAVLTVNKDDYIFTEMLTRPDAITQTDEECILSLWASDRKWEPSVSRPTYALHKGVFKEYMENWQGILEIMSRVRVMQPNHGSATSKYNQFSISAALHAHCQSSSTKFGYFETPAEFIITSNDHPREIQVDPEHEQ